MAPRLEATSIGRCHGEAAVELGQVRTEASRGRREFTALGRIAWPGDGEGWMDDYAGKKVEWMQN